jgi:hypothetical protein
MIVSRWFFLTMRNVSGKSCIENQNTQFMFDNVFPGYRVVCEIVWKKYGRTRQTTDDNIIRPTRFACWITKATDTHSQYVMLITFPRQQWLQERASLLRYTYIDCLLLLYSPLLSLYSLHSRKCNIIRQLAPFVSFIIYDDRVIANICSLLN